MTTSTQHNEAHDDLEVRAPTTMLGYGLHSANKFRTAFKVAAILFAALYGVGVVYNLAIGALVDAFYLAFGATIIIGALLGIIWVILFIVGLTIWCAKWALQLVFKQR